MIPIGQWWVNLLSSSSNIFFRINRVYICEYKDDKRDGVGTLLERSRGRVIYSGLWSDGGYHGKPWLAKVTFEFWSGLISFFFNSGEGVLVERYFIQAADLAAGSPSMGDQNHKNSRTLVYQGTFFHGHRHGIGTLKHDNVVSYEGTWHLDNPVDGKWKIKYQDGSIYSGSAGINTRGPKVENSGSTTNMLKLVTCNLMPQPNGSGTMKYKNGDEYIGTFHFGARWGPGKYHSVSGDVRKGEWKDDDLVIQS